MAMKAKNMMYEQQLAHLPVADVKTLEKIIVALKPTRWAYITHDKDVNKDGQPAAPHVHVMMQFKNARSLKAIAKQLGDKPQYLQKWDGSSNNGYSYLIHATENAHDKFQYEKSLVVANFDFDALMTAVPKEVQEADGENDEVFIKGILNDLDAGVITREQAVDRLSGSQFAKAHTRIKAVMEKRMERLARAWRKQMREEHKSVIIIWLYGEAGTGKTWFAKNYAGRLKRDWFFTGSSRDPFQTYNGEPIVILDELRPDTFEYADLLKMFDPFNDSAMAASRYFDKPLTADTFIVTSPYSPWKFYDNMKKKSFSFDEDIDRFNQLARRISFVQHMNENYTEPAFYDAKSGQFKVDPSKKKRNPFSAKANGSIIQRTQAAYDLYDKLSDISSSKIVDDQDHHSAIKAAADLPPEPIKPTSETNDRDNKMLPPTPAKANDDNTHSKAD